MYGKVLGAANTATGISLLPNTGSNHLLFVVAASMLVSGVVIFLISTMLNRKVKQSKAS